MSDLEFRPRFRIESQRQPEEVHDLIREKLVRDNPMGFQSMSVKGHLIIRVNDSLKHFWSPQLDISISKSPDHDGTLLRCLLAPSPGIWTMFMFLYALAGFWALVGSTIAMSQYTLKKDLWGLWVFGISSVLGIALFFIAQIGKGMAKQEMIDLKNFICSMDWQEHELNSPKYSETAPESF
jgi:hypothetical protein